jgi:hypothetical protein
LRHFGKNGVSLAWSSVKSARFHLKRKLLPDSDEGDFQGFANNEVNKSEITKLVFWQYMKMSMKKT